jgi:hypothetical protein
MGCVMLVRLPPIATTCPGLLKTHVVRFPKGSMITHPTGMSTGIGSGGWSAALTAFTANRAPHAASTLPKKLRLELENLAIIRLPICSFSGPRPKQQEK